MRFNFKRLWIVWAVVCALVGARVVWSEKARIERDWVDAYVRALDPPDTRPRFTQGKSDRQVLEQVWDSWFARNAPPGLNFQMLDPIRDRAAIDAQYSTRMREAYLRTAVSTLVVAFAPVVLWWTWRWVRVPTPLV